MRVDAHLLTLPVRHPWRSPPCSLLLAPMPPRPCPPRVPPEQETRYRQRYLDLMMNPDIQDIFRVRSRVIAGVRSYLDNRGFLEVGPAPREGTEGGGAWYGRCSTRLNMHECTRSLPLCKAQKHLCIKKKQPVHPLRRPSWLMNAQLALWLAGKGGGKLTPKHRPDFSCRWRRP